MKEQSLEQNNLKATLASLRFDIQQEAQNLTQIHIEKNSVKSEIEQFRQEKEIGIAELAKIKAEMLSESSNIEARRSQVGLAEEAAKNELRVIKTQIQEAMSELQRINKWISTGEERKAELDKIIFNLDEQIKEKTKVSEGILEIKNQIAGEEKHLSDIRIESALIVENAKEGKNSTEMQKNEALKMRDAAIQEKTHAEEDTARLQREQGRMKNDLAIYVARVEEYYKKAFPELRMPL